MPSLGILSVFYNGQYSATLSAPCFKAAARLAALAAEALLSPLSVQ